MVTLAPDAELVVTHYLSNHAAITAIGAGVGTSLPGVSKTRPLGWRQEGNWLTVALIGSGGGFRDSRAHWSDQAHVDINAWSTDKTAASLLGRTARAALMELNGLTQQGVVVDVEDLGGPGWLPDTSENPPIPRYIFSISITTHP